MPVPLPEAQLLESLHWRYATKVFDKERKIPAATWQTLEETLRLTPSSFGLQPWKFLVINDPTLRQKLKPVSWHQNQITDASHLVVMAIKKNLGLAEIDALIHLTTQTRQLQRDALAGYRGMMIGNLVYGPMSLQINTWAARQVYIALGNFMTAAALLHIDVCPIEGFEADKYDQILDLPAHGYAATVVAAAGYRSPEDPYAALPKVRYPLADVVEHR